MKLSKAKISKLLDNTARFTLESSPSNKNLAAFYLGVDGNKEAAELFDTLMTAALATGRSYYRDTLEVAKFIYDGDEDKGLERYEELLNKIKQDRADGQT